jgi:hypothetical protein
MINFIIYYYYYNCIKHNSSFQFSLIKKIIYIYLYRIEWTVSFEINFINMHALYDYAMPSVNYNIDHSIHLFRTKKIITIRE